MIMSFDVPHEKQLELKVAVASLINEVLTESDHFLAGSDDLAIQAEESEVIFVIDNANKQRIKAVKQQIIKIVANRLRKNCGGLPILPMLGIGTFPGDSCQVSELEKVARRRAKKMF